MARWNGKWIDYERSKCHLCKRPLKSSPFTICQRCASIARTKDAELVRSAVGREGR